MIKDKLFFVLLLFCASGALAVDLPKRPDPPRLMNDLAGVLSETESEKLESKLEAFNDSTTVQIAVVILSSLDGYPIDDYAFKLAEEWGIGQSSKNNGALLLIAINDRKMWIATGYGLEGTMPDALCRRIIEEDIKPYFKQQQYYQGIDAGTSQMMALVKGDYKATAPPRQKEKLPFSAIIIFILIFIFVLSMKMRSVSRYASLNSIPFWVAWGLLNAARGRQRGRWGDFNSGGGGFGGGSFGGGGGGGGFGGFGGGSFGGGGAGGSW